MRKSKSVEFININKEYVTHSGSTVFKAVDDISVEIKAGEFVTLLGPSGCGKTTTLRMLAGFEIPTSGDIYLGGELINNQPPNKRDTAMVFQSYALFPHYNIFDNVAYGLKIKKLSKAEIKERVKNIIELVGLDGLESRDPNQLSGGQQQRVALARSLVMEPGVLLFDEPLSNLDAKLRVYMRTEIRKIQQRLGLTSVFVTHDQSEAMSLSDRVIVMNKGRIEQVGTPQEIYQQPASEFVADFIGTANFIEGLIKEVDSQHAQVELFGEIVTIPLKANKSYQKGEKVKVVVRPEAITIGREGKFKGTVVTSMFMGNVQEYKVTIQDVTLDIEVANPMGNETFNEFDLVGLTMQEDSLHMI